MANVLDLESLIGSNTSKLPTIEKISISRIRPTPLNKLEIVKIDEAVESLLVFGQLEFIRVRPIIDDQYDYEIVDGQRRFTAFSKIVNEKIENWQDFQEINCIVDADVQNDDELEEKLVEIAIQKRELSAKEKLWLVSTRKKHLQKRIEAGETLPLSITQMIANDLKGAGINREQVRRYSKISSATKEIQKDFADGKLSVLTAAKSADLPAADQMEIHQLALNGENRLAIEKKIVEKKKIQEPKKEAVNKNSILKTKLGMSSIVSCINYHDRITVEIKGEDGIEVVLTLIAKRIELRITTSKGEVIPATDYMIPKNLIKISNLLFINTVSLLLLDNDLSTEASRQKLLSEGIIKTKQQIGVATE